MAAAQDGDSAAYEALLREIVPALRVFVGARLRESAASEDVVQNVLLSLHRARHTYAAARGRSDRGCGRSRATPPPMPCARVAAAPNARPRCPTSSGSRTSASRPAPTCRLSARMTQALAELPPAQREAVELIHVRELSVAEAAEHAGVSVSALKVRAHRGYKALRKLLARAERDD